MQKLRDKTGREIEPGDVLKVFHFTGARRKRHFMYKQALEYYRLPSWRRDEYYLKISHLNRLTDEPWNLGKNYYTEPADGRTLRDYEIVDSIDAKFDERPRQQAETDA